MYIKYRQQQAADSLLPTVPCQFLKVACDDQVQDPFKIKIFKFY